jgi:hypothetical protein
MIKSKSLSRRRSNANGIDDLQWLHLFTLARSRFLFPLIPKIVLSFLAMSRGEREREREGES